jgi:methylmalonyl-CoA mutase
MGPENNASTSTASLESALAAWRAQVDKDLKGADFNKRLVTRTPEGIALQPLYTRADLPATVATTEKPGEAPFRRGWVSQPTCRRLQSIRRPDAATFNKALRDALMNGQDAVVLPRLDAAGEDWSPTSLEELTTALADVEITAVPVELPTGADPLPGAALYLAHAKARGIAPDKLNGSVAADPIGAAALTGSTPTDDQALIDNLAGWTRWCASHAPGIRTVGIDASIWSDAGANAAQELGFALATLAEYLGEFERRDLVELTVLNHTLVTFGVGPKFFTELAKFRAWRVVVSKLLAAMGVDPAAAKGMTVNAEVGSWNKTQLDAHANMLRSTTEALSAVLGGANGLHIPSFDEALGGKSVVGERIARNLHAVVSEEFGFSNPQDAGGGSWYIENLTDQLARAAWDVFRQIQKQGGMRAALKADWPQSQVQNVVASRDSDHALRRSGLIGTNLFPNLQDKLAAEVPAVPVPAGSASVAVGPRAWPDCLTAAIAAIRDGVAIAEAVPASDESLATTSFAPAVPYRAAAVFESLRRRAQKISAERGHAPTALMLKMGPVKQHKPRADFSIEFVSVGGFVPLAKAMFATASEAALAANESTADVAVICSTDDTYPELVPEIARAVKAAKPQMQIVLAGLPREEAVLQSYRDAGVDEFVHVRANVPEILGRLLTAIEA